MTTGWVLFSVDRIFRLSTLVGATFLLIAADHQSSRSECMRHERARKLMIFCWIETLFEASHSSTPMLPRAKDLFNLDFR